MSWKPLIDDDVYLCTVDIVKHSEQEAAIYMEVWYVNYGNYYYDSLVDIKDGMLDLTSIREYNWVGENNG